MTRLQVQLPLAGGILGIFDNQVADATLDFPSSKKRPVQKTAKLEDLSPSQLRQYRNTLGGFGNITEERRKINKLLKGKKKGGKVIKSKTKKNKKIGRPKGVGCATRGYGKAMKRGKQSKYKTTGYEARKEEKS